MASAVKILGISGGVGAAIIIGIIAYGEMTRPPGSDILERPTEQWHAGNSLVENTVLRYRLSHFDNDYQEVIATLTFIERQGDDWRTSIKIEDKNVIKEQELLLSKSLIILTPVEEAMKPYIKMVQSSILWIVDYAIEPKYLAGGAVWGSITFGVQKEDLKITAKERITIESGTYDSFVLSYKIKDKESRVWIVKDKPLPVKAEVYDANGKLQFKFELIESN
ncbi:MAG: hypothetical protein QXU32_07790 [Nitrososphaerales archaeon]